MGVMAVQPSDPKAPPARIHKKSRGHIDRDALLDTQRPIGDTSHVVPIMLDGIAVMPEMTVQQAYDHNYEVALAKRYQDALADIRELAQEFDTTLDALVDPAITIDQNLTSLRATLSGVPTTDPFVLTPYTKLSMAKIQAAADARISTLNVQASLRYDNQGGARYACNCYAGDYLQFHPDSPYLPRIWWTHDGRKKLEGGATEFGTGDYYAVNSNDLNRWFHTESKRFGWVHVEGNDVDKAQESANLGLAVIASGKGLTEAGHIVMFAPEDEHNRIVAHRVDGKIRENGFVRSQAGAVNVGRAVSYESTNVFDADHANAGIWRYDPTQDESRDLPVVRVG
jgi:hypothetical protein